MITVGIIINDEGKATNTIMDGHADHDEYGHDIACAGTSVVLSGSVNATIGLTSERSNISYDGNGGYFHIRSVDTNNDGTQLIPQTMFVSLQAIEEGCNENIRLDYK